MQVSTRAIEIIACLLEQADYTSVAAISEQLGISKRTVFREMETVEEVLTMLGIQSDKKARKGIKLFVTTDQKKAFIELIDKQMQLNYTQEMRQNILIIELLKSRDAQKLYYYANLLNVSEATISNDMDKLEAWFADHQLTLTRKPGFGVLVEGTEKNFRRALVDFLYQTFDHEELVDLINDDLFQTKTNTRSLHTDNMLGVIDKEILLKVNRVLKTYESILEKRLAEGAYLGLMIHLSIAVSRIQRNENIHMHKDIIEGLKRDDHFETARAIARSIAEAFDIRVPEDEVGYITMHLQGSKLKTGAIHDQHDFILSNFEITRMASKMIKAFKQHSGYDFGDDEKLLIGLASHLRPAITRMKLGLDIRNPLLNKIQEMYPEIMMMTKQTSHLLSDKYEIDVPEAEVGFLAMHFGAAIERYRKFQVTSKFIKVGVVCSSGVGTSTLLASRLTKMVPNIELVGQFSKEDVLKGHAKALGVRCLISTIPLEEMDCPTVKVNPLLLESDTHKIKQVLSILQQELMSFNDAAPLEEEAPESKMIKIHSMAAGILEIVQGFEVLSAQTFKDTDALITYIANHYGPSAKDRASIHAQLTAREALGTTLLKQEGLKLLHTKTDAVDQLTFAVVRLSRPMAHVDHGLEEEKQSTEIDLVVLMLMPMLLQKHKVAIMTYLSKLMIEDPQFVKHLKTMEAEKLRQLINRKLNLWFDSQMRG